MSRRERDRGPRDRGARDKKRTIAAANLALVPAGTLMTVEARGYTECPCTKKCTIHGECELCVAYHALKNATPRCERS